MLRIFCAAIILCGALLCTPHALAQPDTPIGTWLRAGGKTVFAIAACSTGLCGRIAGMSFSHPADPQPLNWQGQLMCGEAIIQVAPEQGARNKWHGTIINPKTGDVWQATLTLMNGTLQLRGYFGVPLLGKTETWTRYHGAIGPGCHITPGT